MSVSWYLIAGIIDMKELFLFLDCLIVKTLYCDGIFVASTNTVHLEAYRSGKRYKFPVIAIFVSLLLDMLVNLRVDISVCLTGEKANVNELAPIYSREFLWKLMYF